MAYKSDKFYGQLTCGLVAATVLAIGSFWIKGLSTGMERFVFDRTQRATPAQVSKDVVLIGIDADSKSHLGDWPWPNSLHAQLIDELRAAGSKTVVFTMPLAGTRGSANLDRVRAAMAILQSSDIANSGRAEELRRLLSGSVENLDDDQQLIRAMTAHGQVLLSAETSLQQQLGNEGNADTLSLSAWPAVDAEALAKAQTARVVSSPLPALSAAAKGVGHLLSPPDSDEVIRSELTGVKVGDHLLPSLAVLAAASATNRIDKLRYSDDSLSLSDAELPLGSKLAIATRNFPIEGPTSVPKYSYWEVLAGKAPATEFKDKVVLVGFTDGPNADRVMTPISVATPRAVLMASTTQSLINGDVYRRPVWSIAVQILASLAVIAVAAVALPSLGLNLGALLSIAVIGLLLGAEISLLAYTGIWLQLTLPCLAMLLAYGAHAGGLRWPAPSASEKLTTNPDGLRTLALTLQGQGQLDLAYETFRRCPMDATTLDLLYRLGTDFERRRQLSKAANIFAHIVSVDANYRDAREKSERYASEKTVKEDAPAPAPAPAPAAKPKASTPSRKSGAEKAQSNSANSPAQNSSKETLGRYEIERQIGKGAMGVVYLGRDPKINRVVAIKAIPLAEEFEDSDLAEAHERFFREAEMAGRLNHPSIVTVYDAGEDRGLAYIAMEFLRGEHLSFYAEPQNLLPVRKVLPLVARLADALDYAHRQNVIHRDIKPANIMFNVETDTLKITDFGIARLTDVSRTKTGIVLGTPSFMSPEQLEGRSIDGRSDLFALGVALYQLLSAQLPFRADSMTRLMNKIATEPHTPLRSIRPELPAALEAVLDRALAKAADARYQTGADMAEALRSCMRALES